MKFLTFCQPFSSTTATSRVVNWWIVIGWKNLIKVVFRAGHDLADGVHDGGEREGEDDAGQQSSGSVVVDPDLQIPEPHEETHVGRDARQLSSTVLGVVAGSRNRRLKIICNSKIKI